MRWAGAVLFGVFLFVALFGLPMLLSHTGHHTGCPLMGAQAVMCENTIVEHFSLWQAMFASVLNVLIVLCTCVAFVVIRGSRAAFVQERIRLRLGMLANRRPTVLQELFSRGILNRKEPFCF